MKAMIVLAGFLLVGCVPSYNDFPPPPPSTPTVVGRNDPHAYRPPVTPTGFVQVRPTQTVGPVSGALPPERNDPVLMVQTLFDLLQRGDRATAQTYWRDPAATAKDIEKINTMFPAGSTETYEIGEVIPNGAAGTIYFAVPVAMTTHPVSGPAQRYAVCITLSLSNVPTGNTTPPYPIVVRSAQVHTTTADGNTVMALATAMARSGDCQSS